MKKILSILLVAACGLAACSSERISNFPSHKLTVVQGNQVEAEAVAALQRGMTQEQVQHLLGTPLLRDPLHQNRWDYVYHTARNGVLADRRALTLYFDAEGRLERLEGSVWDESQAEHTRLAK